MRTSLKKLRGFGIHKHADRKIRRLQPAAQQLDELARAAQDMQDMRDCYDSLLSAAAATANSAYEFSESLKELGACLLEKTALNDDEESGKVLLMLGKVQFELQRLVDKYRSHIFQTITSPSESLLNELRIVEEMKRLCDEKRTVYEHMMTTHGENERVRNRKESFSIQELQTAYDEYDEEATLFVFRLKSLKQGQSRSLLTQAARHHAAQLCFFKKALRSLDTVEPNVKLVTEQQHIDYQFMGLDDEDDGNDGYTDDGIDDENGSGESSSEISDGELSFDYAPNLKGQNIVSTRRDSMELDRAEVTFSQVATVDEGKENVDQPGQDYFAFGRDTKTSSQSAPLFAEKKFDPAERVRQMRQLSSRKFHSYVLPTPGESKNPVSMKADPQVFQTRRASLNGAPINYRHSSPLEERKHEKVAEEEKLSASMRLSQPPAMREGNNTIKSMGFPSPLAEELSSQQQDAPTTDSKKIKRQALSGPLTGKSWPNKRGLSASGHIDPLGPPKLFSGPILPIPVPHRSSPPKLSPSASPTFALSPRISELHELPRPPPSNFVASYSNQIGYSGPLVSKRQEISAANRLMPRSASPLPPPPLTVTRSFSIPTRGQKAAVSPMSMPLGVPLNSKIAEDMISPPLTPISFSNIQPASPAS